MDDERATQNHRVGARREIHHIRQHPVESNRDDEADHDRRADDDRGSTEHQLY